MAAMLGTPLLWLCDVTPLLKPSLSLLRVHRIAVEYDADPEVPEEVMRAPPCAYNLLVVDSFPSRPWLQGSWVQVEGCAPELHQEGDQER